MLRDARLRVDFSTSTFYPIMALMLSSDVVLDVVSSAGHAADWAAHCTLGELMPFFGILGMLYGPLSSLTQLTNWLTNFTTQLHRIFEVLDTPVSINVHAVSACDPEDARRDRVLECVLN